MLLIIVLLGLLCVLVFARWLCSPINHHEPSQYWKDCKAAYENNKKRFKK